MATSDKGVAVGYGRRKTGHHNADDITSGTAGKGTRKRAFSFIGTGGTGGASTQKIPYLVFIFDNPRPACASKVAKQHDAMTLARYNKGRNTTTQNMKKIYDDGTQEVWERESWGEVILWVLFLSVCGLIAYTLLGGFQ